MKDNNWIEMISEDIEKTKSLLKNSYLYNTNLFLG